MAGIGLKMAATNSIRRLQIFRMPRDAAHNLRYLRGGWPLWSPWICKFTGSNWAIKENWLNISMCLLNFKASQVCYFCPAGLTNSKYPCRYISFCYVFPSISDVGMNLKSSQGRIICELTDAELQWVKMLTGSKFWHVICWQNDSI